MNKVIYLLLLFMTDISLFLFVNKLISTSRAFLVIGLMLFCITACYFINSYTTELLLPKHFLSAFLFSFIPLVWVLLRPLMKKDQVRLLAFDKVLRPSFFKLFDFFFYKFVFYLILIYQVSVLYFRVF